MLMLLPTPAMEVVSMLVLPSFLLLLVVVVMMVSVAYVAAYFGMLVDGWAKH